MSNIQDCIINMQLIHVSKHGLKSKLYKQLADFKKIYIIINK